MVVFFDDTHASLSGLIRRLKLLFFTSIVRLHVAAPKPAGAFPGDLRLVGRRARRPVNTTDQFYRPSRRRVAIGSLDQFLGRMA